MDSENTNNKKMSVNDIQSVPSVGIEAASIDILKETKEKPDITKPSADSVNATVIAKQLSATAATAVVETVMPSVDVTVKDSVAADASMDTVFTNKPSTQVKVGEVTIKTSMGGNAADEGTQEITCKRGGVLNRGKMVADGFEGKMNKLRDQMSNIFPVGTMGCKENKPQHANDHQCTEDGVCGRRFMDKKEASLDCVGHIENTPRKRPSSSKPNNARNPLTGIGLDEIDDLRKGNGRRKDGNPVLGVGYEKQPNKTPTTEVADSKEVKQTSTTRIPPGGHSQGLW